MRNKNIPSLILAGLLIFPTTDVFAVEPDVPGGAEEKASIEASSAYRPGIPINVIEKITLPKGYHEGLFLDGENIWVNNGKNMNTWIISPKGEVLGEIIPPGTFTEGLTDSAEMGKFWVTDWDTKKLYSVGIENGKMVPYKEFSFSPALPTGVVRADNALYVMTWTRGLGTMYHLLELDKDGDLLKKMSIKGISEPSQIAWDGLHLWITSWYSQKVYQVDPKSFTVMGYFDSPAKDTTGIAWDGEYFWITGTYDDLYKVKVER